MLRVEDVTVGQVSGMIAAGVFVVQILIPTALPIILLGLLRERNSSATASAVTWSTVSRFLHSSYWPTILSTDSSSTRGVPLGVVVITTLKILLALIIGLAAIITPLGLYESIVPAKSTTSEVFHYIKDTSPLGYGTPPRSNLPWSRICGAFSPIACPNSFTGTNITYVENATGIYYPNDSYDSHVPQYVIDLFESGLETMNKSVSSIFDIQSRSYSWSQINTNPGALAPDGGKQYPVAAFRTISSIVLANDVLVVEGLVVDMKNGGIGFRNHSAPPVQPYGSVWSEDILFIEPESQCVDTNLTLDFTIPKDLSGLDESISDFVLTDRGGFANLAREYPRWNRSDPQNDPGLEFRAYQAAWLNNFWSMVFMNVTNLRNESDPKSPPPFQYLESHVGKAFPLMYANSSFPNINISPGSMTTTSLYGNYLEGLDQGVPGAGSNNSIFNNSTIPGFNLTTPYTPPLYLNPFQVSLDNFSSAGLICQGAGGQDYANISNIASECGLIQGAPRLQDGSTTLLFEPGSKWTVPMYSCITVTRALVKTVTFSFNGSDDLTGLSVTNVVDKVYPNDESKPLWGVEHTKIPLANLNVLWGIIASENTGNVSLSTLRKDFLYLPGYAQGLGPFSTGYQNLPGVDFHLGAMEAAYQVGSSSVGMPDYSGSASLAMYSLWQSLTRTAATAGNILNLIWTDIAANSVVGTKTMAPQQQTLQKRDNNGATSNSNLVPVTIYSRRVQYHIPFAIPAFVTLLTTLCTILATAYMVSSRRAGLSKMRKYLNITSVGRLLTSLLPKEEHERGDQNSAKAWTKAVGRKKFTLGKSTDGVVVIELPGGASNAQESSHSRSLSPFGKGSDLKGSIAVQVQDAYQDSGKISGSEESTSSARVQNTEQVSLLPPELRPEARA